MLALTWVTSVAVSLPIAVGMNYTDRRAQTPDVCTFYNAEFLIYSSMTSFYIPCVVIVLLYWRIFRRIPSRLVDDVVLHSVRRHRAAVLANIPRHSSSRATPRHRHCCRRRPGNNFRSDTRASAQIHRHLRRRQSRRPRHFRCGRETGSGSGGEYRRRRGVDWRSGACGRRGDRGGRRNGRGRRLRPVGVGRLAESRLHGRHGDDDSPGGGGGGKTTTKNDGREEDRDDVDARTARSPVSSDAVQQQRAHLRPDVIRPQQQDAARQERQPARTQSHQDSRHRPRYFTTETQQPNDACGARDDFLNFVRNNCNIYDTTQH